MEIKELKVSQKMGVQMLKQFKTEAEKKLLMEQYIVGKLVSDLMRFKYLKVTESSTEDGKDVLLEASIKVVNE